MKKIFIKTLIIILLSLTFPINILYASEENIDITIGMNSALGNIYENGNAGFFICISNNTSTNMNIDISYSVKGETYTDYSFSDIETVKVLCGEEKEFVFSLPQDRYGIYKLDVSALTKEFSDTFAVIPNHQKQFLEEYTRHGIATQYERGGRTDSNDKILMDKAGVKHIRDGILWTKHEKEKGLFDYSYTDLWYENVSEDIYSLVMGLWYNSPLYNGNKSDKYGVSDRYQAEAYANYARNMARRYRNVSEFEIWNEPDYGSFWLPEGDVLNYVNMLKIASAEIKQINPKVSVAAGSVSKTSETDFVRNIFEFGGYPYFDAVSVHPYVSPQYDADDEYSVSRYESYTDLILEYGGWKDIIATEVGWPTHSGGATLKRQAQQLIKQNVIADKYGFNANEWFTFRDAGTNSGDKEDNFGVLKNDYTPKPAYIALCSLNHFLAGAVYCGEVSWMTGAEAYLYIKDGIPIVTAWSKEQAVSITCLGSNVTAFDIYGNECTDMSVLSSDGSPFYFTNVDYSVFDRVIAEETESSYEEYLQKYETYLPQSVRTFIESGTAISSTNVDTVEAMVDTHYSNGTNIITEYSSDDMKTLSGMLYDWHHIGEKISLLYLKNEITEADVVYNAKHEIRKMNHKLQTSADSKAVDMFPYSEAVSRFAQRYCDRALEVRNMESNKMKYGYSKMCNDISRNLAKLASEFCKYEQGENPYIIMNVSSDELTLEGDVSDLNISIKNYKKEKCTGKICVYASDGMLIACSEDITLIPLIGKEVELEIDNEFYSATTQGYAQLCFVQDGRTAVSQKIIFEIA